MMIIIMRDEDGMADGENKEIKATARKKTN
jgi:hypothetical protein